jgi:simple sugar transport system substrate-binding protein
VEDYGWTYAHDQGRLYVEEHLPWLKTCYAESVSDEAVERVAERMIMEEGCDVIFTTSFGFGDGTLKCAKRHPDKIFFHCSGYRRAANVGTYFAEFYQIFYLNGLAAGALTQTNKLGYVGAFTTPELIRAVNAYALGAQEINPEITVDTRWTYNWVFAPAAAIEATEGLISEGCDMISLTIDTPDIPRTCESYTESMSMGYPILSFSHYSPMTKFAPHAILSGQLVKWGPMYADILMKIHNEILTPKNLENVDYWDMLASGNVFMGANWEDPINPEWIPGLEKVMVNEKITGQRMNVYDLIMLRVKQMTEKGVLFDPYTGPIYDTEDRLLIPPGVRADHDFLWANMKGVRGVSLPSE